ncbi:unnamed protein product, partial [Sphacelaria rigidula]
TDALTSPPEKARCLSLLADLALDPACARTLFRGGAVPQMLLNVQGCTHVDETPAAVAADDDEVDGVGRGVVGEGFECGDGRTAAAAATVTAVENAPNGGSDDVLVAGDEGEFGAGVGGGAPRRVKATVEVCRCRQAMRLLTRLVRGLPMEAPAVVVRHPGLGSIVQLLETAGGGSDGGVSSAAEAAAGGALELFVAISERSRQRKELGRVPGVLESTSSYVVSKKQAQESKAGKGFGSKNYFIPATKTTTIFAFRLLANLAYADGARGRIMGFGGLTLAAAAAVSSAADEITHRSRRSVTNSNSSRNIGTSAAAAAAGCAVEAAGEAAAALLHRLSPVLGAEGSEDQLVAAGEALSAAVHAVSTASPGVGVVDTDTMGNLRGLVTEALSALLILSWSDAVNLEAAAAIDWVITDAALVSSVVSLWRQGMMPPPPSPFALSSMALPFLSSVAHRQAGRSSLVAADFPSSIFSVVLQETTAAMAATMDGGPEATGEPERGLLLLSIAERAELLSLICVLCASPTHRAVVRASLLSSTSVASGNETESEAAMEAQLVRLQGDNSQSSWECRSNIARLASLLGLSPP